MVIVPHYTTLNSATDDNNAMSDASEDVKKANLAKILVDKLGRGRARMILEGFMYTPNDILASDRAELSGSLILTLKGYVDAFGFDGMGRLGGYTNKATFKKVAEYLNDLCYLQQARRDLEKPAFSKTVGHQANFKELYGKYGKLTGRSIANVAKLERTICEMALAIVPKIVDQTSLMMTLGASDIVPPLDNLGRTQPPPRFNPRAFEGND